MSDGPSAPGVRRQSIGRRVTSVGRRIARPAARRRSVHGDVRGRTRPGHDDLREQRHRPACRRPGRHLDRRGGRRASVGPPGQWPGPGVQVTHQRDVGPELELVKVDRAVVAATWSPPKRSAIRNRRGSVQTRTEQGGKPPRIPRGVKHSQRASCRGGCSVRC